MSYANEYVRNIAFYLIFMSLAGIISPEGKYKKYINVILGLILIVILVSPIQRLFNANGFDVDEIFDSLDLSSTPASDVSDYEDMRDQAVSGEYLALLKAQTESILSGSAYNLSDMTADFDTNTGEIKSMHLKVIKLENPPDEPPTEKVKRPFIRIEPIKINNRTIAKANEETDPEITDIKKIISDFYSVPIDNIHIEITANSD